MELLARLRYRNMHATESVTHFLFVTVKLVSCVPNFYHVSVCHWICLFYNPSQKS